MTGRLGDGCLKLKSSRIRLKGTISRVNSADYLIPLHMQILAERQQSQHLSSGQNSKLDSTQPLQTFAFGCVMLWLAFRMDVSLCLLQTDGNIDKKRLVYRGCSEQEILLLEAHKNTFLMGVEWGEKVAWIQITTIKAAERWLMFTLIGLHRLFVYNARLMGLGCMLLALSDSWTKQTLHLSCSSPLYPSPRHDSIAPDIPHPRPSSSSLHLTLFSVMTASWFTPVMLNVSPVSPSRMVYSSLAFSPRSASVAEMRPISAPGMASSETEKDHMPGRDSHSLELIHFNISFCLLNCFQIVLFQYWHCLTSFDLTQLRGWRREIKEEKGRVCVCVILSKVR